MIQITFALVTSCSVLLLSAPLAAQHFPSNEDLTALIQDRGARAGAGGIVLGVLEADGTTRIVSYGDAGEGVRELSGTSLFEIGSVTKVFTATLLANMVSRGEVALSDPVADYLPEGVTMPSRNGRHITLLDLATHHSGLPNLPSDWPRHSGFGPRPEYTPAQLYAHLSQYQLTRDVGSQFVYSNIGVGLLGHVLERVGGGSYEEVLRARILDPLRMSLTSTSRDGERQHLMTRGHDLGGVIAPYRDFPHFPGIGGLKSNAQELLRFLAANVGAPRSQLERAMRDGHEMREPYSPERGIALNWHLSTVGDARIVWHGGSTLGYESFIGFDPESGVGTVVLANSRHRVVDLGMHLINRESPLDTAGGRTPMVVLAGLVVFAVGLGVAVRRMRRTGRSHS